MDQVDCVVIGAGVVGLACARALALAGHEVVIVERETKFGTGASARNSEVIHSGIYYPAGSRKAEWCVRGAQLLYAYCAERGVAHRRCGKLLVATSQAEVGALEALHARGVANGVQSLALLTAAQAMAMEPALRCVAALWSPDSGIVDSHGLMTALLGDAENAGAVLAVNGGVVGARPDGNGGADHGGDQGADRSGDDSGGVNDAAGGWQVNVRSAAAGEPDFSLHARWIINAAGLDAQAVAARMQGFPAAAISLQHLAKGHYFSLQGRVPFSRLIYPMPTHGGLGIHLTLDLGGQAKFGPDVEWLASDAAHPHAESARDYRVDASRATGFESEIRRYWPGLPSGALAPAYSGIRPKLSGPGEPAVDFRVDGPKSHGCAGVVQLFGIESPGLTASMAIADAVAQLVGQRATEATRKR